MANDEEHKLPALTSGGSIRAIVPADFEGAWRIAKAVCVAGMAPRGLENPEKCTVAILHGLEVGLPPMAALQSIAVINGRPTVWGDGALGLVQGSGKLQSIKEWMDGTGDGRVAYCRVLRHGDPEPKLGKFSVADAKQAHLWGKEKSPWITYPDRMLKMRARAWALRDGFSDVLKGLGIAEEVRDMVEPSAPPAPPAPPVKGPKADAGVPKHNGPPPPPARQNRTEVAKPAMKPVQEEAFDPDTGEVVDEGEGISPTELLAELEEAMATAKTKEEVETIFDDYEVEDRLAETFIGVALKMRRDALKKVAA